MSNTGKYVSNGFRAFQSVAQRLEVVIKVITNNKYSNPAPLGGQLLSLTIFIFV